MSYQVKYTETTNPAKPAITVEDQTLNGLTSLKFPGKNYAGYGPVIAENFLHLLENFARNTAPGTQAGDGSPVQGQLWYDNSAGVNLLKVYDGNSWTPAGAIKKADTIPSVANSTQGDLWVDTDNSQLYVYSGSNWLLIGPQFSSGLKTGPDIETITDTGTPPVDHAVITMWAENNRMAIISKAAFTPKQTIAGFTTIKQGVNLSTVDITSTTAPTKFWGVASTADSLTVAGKEVAASAFLRSDQANTLNYGISIRNNAGIVLGNDLSFSLSTDANTTIFYSKTSGNSIDFKINNAGIPTTVLHVDAASKVGIGANNTNPTEALDVAGNISLDGNLIVLGTTDSTAVGIGSITTNGGLSVSKQSRFNGAITAEKGISFNNLDSIGNPVAASVILPGTDSANNLYDIGSSTRRFRNIYAQTFVGSFNGSFTGSLSGSITGSAAKLASPTAFSLTGDVSSNIVNFDGQSSTGTAIFTTSVSQDIIATKTVAQNSLGVANSQSNDEMLVFRPNVGLRKVAKSTFVSNIPTVPVGAIFPFAGSVVPAGYLLCDGGEVTIGAYSALFQVIGYTYRPAASLAGASTFALPDLRGRFPLGRDNMDNGNEVPSKNNVNVPINAGGGSANRVTDVVADTLGGGTGSEQRTLSVSNLPQHKHTLSTGQADYFAVGRPGLTTDTNGVTPPGPPTTSNGLSTPNTGDVISSSIGQPINTMNPYLTINYIIFTGVI